jgi:hypothetical protein
MVSVTGVVWLIAPDVPVTMTETLLAADGFELDDPHPTVNRTPTISRLKIPVQIPACHFRLVLPSRRGRTAKTIPNKPIAENDNQIAPVPGMT